ncbi:MAG: hypothetical protein LIP02_07270, partial [Bacteroidales bacterium]|nr:hypothetical protein [Bacteroidales bacterium]
CRNLIYRKLMKFYLQITRVLANRRHGFSKAIGFEEERRDTDSKTIGNVTLLGQIASFAEALGLGYNEIVREIPYRQLLLMQKDKARVCHGQKVVRMTGKEMAAKRGRRDNGG